MKSFDCDISLPYIFILVNTGSLKYNTPVAKIKITKKRRKM